MVYCWLNFLDVRSQHLLFNLLYFEAHFLGTRREEQETENGLPASKSFIAPLQGRISEAVNESANQAASFDITTTRFLDLTNLIQRLQTYLSVDFVDALKSLTSAIYGRCRGPTLTFVVRDFTSRIFTLLCLGSLRQKCIHGPTRILGLQN